MSNLYPVGFFGGKFLPFHTGHLNCILRAASQCEKLYVVLMYNGPEELAIMAQDDGAQGAPVFPKRYLTPHIRELALRRELAFLPNVEVIAYDCQGPDERAIAEGKHPWFYECEDMVALMCRFDVAYSSEPEYAVTFKEFYPWADAVVLDDARDAWPISGTMLREMPLSQAYAYLPRAYQQLVNKKVLLTGTESCGKTTLVRKLASLFNTSYTKEYGRLVSESFGMCSPGGELYNDFLYGQKALETKAIAQANRVAICDSDALVTAFYANRFEDRDLPIARAMAAEHDYDLVIYIEPTVPWVADGTRLDSEDAVRWQNDEAMKSLYRDAGIPLHVLNGTYEENYLEAVSLIRGLLDT